MVTKVQKIEGFLSKSQCLKIFTLKGGFFKLMNKNNTLIELNVGKIARKINKANKIKLERVIKEVLLREFAPALLYIFEIFQQFFEQLSMQGQSPLEIQGEEQGPNFILQPFQLTYLLPPIKEKEFTLVLDLDETLIHFQEGCNGGQFFLRPFSQEFIKKMHSFFELVIFTAAVKDYADWILDRLDPENLISHRLYRCSTTE